jgi:RimJ/RimL family protein N-acetyltransferase
VLQNARVEALLRKMADQDYEHLVAMYEEFEPKGEFQGLPPRSTSQIRKWLTQLSELGFFQFVVEVGGRIVGHCMLCPSPRKTEAELAIFLHQDYRGYGLGKKLLLGTLNFGCKRLDLQYVWLFVTGSNPVALRLFEDVGFRPRSNGDPLAWEIEMERPSHCATCKGDKCTVFGGGFPMIALAHARCATKR